MKIIRGLHNLQERHHDSVITIGNFDGIHLGHQAIIKQLVSKARELACFATVITFHPNPQEYFSPTNPPAKITPFYDKMHLLKSYGIDQVVCLPFNAKLAELNAEDFITQILIYRLGIKHIIIGDDFKFGKNRQGDLAMLNDYGKVNQFTVETTPSYFVNKKRVSSTIIRQNMAETNITHCKELLGRTYKISGIVAHGDKRGRTIGFPTANIRLKQQIAPTNGVYAVKITGLGKTLTGVANLGVRPTVDGSLYLLEVHIFDFDQSVYRKRITVSFEHFIRKEQRFNGLDALVSQIQQDSETAKELLNQLTTTN